MKTLALALAVALAALVPTTASAAPLATESHCQNTLKQPVECAVWAVQCAGYALGGNPCYGAAAQTTSVQVGPPEPCDVADCEKVVWVVRCVGDALGGHACHAETTTDGTPDPEAILACLGTAIQNWLDGVTPEMCTID